MVAFAAGWQHTCALLTGSGVQCWGDNNEGQLGTGDTTNRLYPTEITALQPGISL